MAGRNLFATDNEQQQQTGGAGRNLFASAAPSGDSRGSYDPFAAPVRPSRGANLLSAAQPVAAEPEYDPNEGLSGFDKTLIGIGRGVVDVGEGVNQAGRKVGEYFGLTDAESTKAYEDEVRAERALFEKNLGGDTAASVGRFIGQTAPTLIAPGAAAGASLTRAAAASGLAGAGFGGLEFVDEQKGQSRLQNALTAGLTGAGAGAAFSLGGKVLDNTVARFKADKAGGAAGDVEIELNRLGVGADDIDDATRARIDDLVQNEGLTPAQALRQADAEAQGIQLTRGQLSRDFRDQQFESEAAKFGTRDAAPLRQRLEETNRTFGKQFDDLLKQTNPNVSDTFDAGELLRRSLEAGQEQQDKLVREAYKAARSKSGGEPIQTPQLANVLETALDFRELVPGVSGIERQLKRFGALDEAGLAGRGMSLQQAEGVRKTINQMISGSSPQERFYLNQIKEALDADVIRGAGGDIFGDARAVAQQGFAKFKDVKPVQAILEGRVSDEKIIEGILKPSSSQTWSIAQIKGLKNTVDSINPQAWQDVKAGTVQWIRNQATQGNARNEAGESIFSGANMNKALDKIGKQKLDILFSKKEQQTLRQLARTMDAVTGRVPGSVNTSNTSSAAFNRMVRLVEAVPGGATIFSPIMGALRAVAGGARDIAESREIRESLENPVKSLARRGLKERREDVVKARQQRRSGAGRFNVRPRLGPALGASLTNG